MRQHYLLAILFSIVTATAALAQEPLKVEVGKSTLLKITQQPTVVMIGNPAIADLIIETSGVMFLVGLEPGETNLYMLNNKGERILDTSILVTPKLDRHVTIHRGLSEATMSCNPRCVIVRTPAVGGGGGSTSIAHSDTAAADDAGAESTEAASAGGQEEAITNLTNSLLNMMTTAVEEQ